MTLTPVSRWTGMPSYFNDHVADAVYDTIMKMDDDEAVVVADMLVGDIYQADLEVHETLIEKALHDHLDSNGEQIRDALLRNYVSKRAAGESVEGLLGAAEVISKAFGDDRYSRDEHGHFASIESRARRAHSRSIEETEKLHNGEFLRSHHPIVINTHDDDGRRRKPLDDKTATRAGIVGGEGLNGAAKLRYQQAYRQVSAIVGPYAARDRGDHFVHLHHPGGVDTHAVADLEAGIELPKNVSAVGVSRIPDFDHNEMGAYDTLRAMGGNYGTQADEEGRNAGVDRIRTLDRGLRDEGGAFDRAGTRTMRRLGAASSFLDDSFSDSEGNSYLPKKAAAALRAGQVVGLYGPEAQNVIGPVADRAAYRYRGTERAPDRKLMTAMENLRRNPNLKTAEDRREIAIHGLETDNGWRPSGVLNYFRGRLPDQQLNTLQRKSGTIPPSEGIILNARGKVMAQAVGYGDDHYLPFNLNKLRSLRGGEYVRTRSWGGPTTEDIYTGLISGAKSSTVVSHNGVYTVEFDPDFKGSRRYNDKAARMVARYGQLLDAVKNGEITTGQVDMSRHDELIAEASSQYDPDTEPQEYRAELIRLEARERRNPTLSNAQRAEVAQSFLDNEALKSRTPDGHEMTREELVDSWLTNQAGRELAEVKAQGMPSTFYGSTAPMASLADLKAEIARTNGLQDDDPVRFSENAIRAMGLQDRFGKYSEREEKNYRASLKPLELNGPGYDMALHALQEQFPYYIKSVEFHPWSDAKNGRDTGYVKPKHNRPAEALSGYFDSSINGESKVHADSIRGQGARKEARPYQRPAERIAAAREKAGEVGSGLQARASGSRLSPDTARELRYDSDRQLIAELKAQRNFGSGANGTRGGGSLGGFAGQPITAGTGEDRARLGELGTILDQSTAELERQQDTPEGAERLHRQLQAAMKIAETHGLLPDLDPAKVRAFHNEGRPAESAKFDRTQTAANLRGLDSDRDFGQAVLTPGAQMDPVRVQDAYRDDAKVKELGLPPLGSPEFGPAVAAAKESLDKRQRAIVQWELRPGSQGRPANAHRVPFLVEGLARAKQYERRYNEALAAQEQSAPVMTGAGGGLFFRQGGQEFPVDMTSGSSIPTASGGSFTPMSHRSGHDVTGDTPASLGFV